MIKVMRTTIIIIIIIITIIIIIPNICNHKINDEIFRTE